MLQTIREHTQGWIAGIIISLIILSFAFWGIHSYFTGGADTNIVAKVNGTEVTRSQLNATYERLRRQAEVQYGSKAADQAFLKNRALQMLIEVEILKQASIKHGFQISDRQLDNFLQGMPEFQVNERFSVERLQEFLSSSMLSTGEFLELIRTSLLMDQPKIGIVLTSFALPNETNNTIALVNQERDISYVNLPLQFFLSQPITISNDLIKNYYNDHQKDFMTPEQVSVEFVELNMNDLIAKLTPNDDVLKNFYNDNINSFTKARSWKLMLLEFPLPNNVGAEEAKQIETKVNAAYQALNKGDDFNKIAKQYNANVVNKDNVTLSQLEPELQKVVENLNKPGEIANPIRTTKNFVIVKSVEITEPKVESFETSKDKVKAAYLRQHAEEKFAETREQLADATYEHADSLQYASKTLSLPIKTTTLFDREKGGKDISQYKKVREQAFSNDVMNLQNNSDVIQINPETVLVLRIKSHVPAKLLPLADVSKQIESKLRVSEAEKRALAAVNDIKAKLETNPTATMANYKLNWQNAGFIGRYSKKVDNAILDTAFRLPNPAGAGKTVYGMARTPTGYAIIALRAVKDGNMADQKQKVLFAEQVQNSLGMLEYELYKQSAIKAAKVKIY